MTDLPAARPLDGLSISDELPMAEMARALSKSALVPESYRGDPGSILIAMDIARRIGASPFSVLQNLDVIHGRPAWRASFLIATVNASKRFSPLRYRFEGEPGRDDWGCRAVATDRESGEECVGALITIALAKSEGWATKNGSKWRTMPEQMLMYRAAAFWSRTYCPELSLGIYTREEMVDMVDADGVVTRAPRERVDAVPMTGILAPMDSPTPAYVPQNLALRAPAQPLPIPQGAPPTEEAPAPKRGRGRPRKLPEPAPDTSVEAATAHGADVQRVREMFPSESDPDCGGPATDEQKAAVRRDINSGRLDRSELPDDIERLSYDVAEALLAPPLDPPRPELNY